MSNKQGQDKMNKNIKMKIKRQIELNINIRDINKTDIECMDNEQLRFYALAMQEELKIFMPQVKHQDKTAKVDITAQNMSKNALKSVIDTMAPPQDKKEVIDNPRDTSTTTEPVISTESTNADNKIRRMPYGQKKGKTSKYHYVWFTYSLGRYEAGISIRTAKGKPVSKNVKKIIVGSFDDELSAACAIDKYLDLHQLHKQTRNRFEFPEVYEIHQAELRANENNESEVA